MSGKVCEEHEHEWRQIWRRLCACLLILAVIVLIIVLITWAILSPNKPRFVIQDATVYAFNVSSSNFLTTNIQITVSSHNPNDNIGVYYDRLDAYATFNGQQITLQTSIPPTYQGHKEVNVWSPLVYGNAVPVAPYNAVSLSQDRDSGAVPLLIKIDGRVRWKVGSFISGRYHLHVKCPAFITFGGRNTGINVGDAVKYQLVQKCSVNV